METRAKNKNKFSFMPTGIPARQILPALAAVSSACSIIAGPAAALELGELTIESKLGQPLRASIAYALQPDEQLHDFCIFLNPGVPGDGLPVLSKARISVSGAAIQLRGATPVLEPMLGLRLSIDCPYTARLQREYAMFFDFNPGKQSPPALLTETDSRVMTAGTAGDAVGQRRQESRSRATRNITVDQTPIATGTRYRVQAGDSLSTIVARISDRPPGLWSAVEKVYAANPQAFIDGDVNLLKAGSWLDIPDLNAATRTAASRPESAIPAPASMQGSDGSAVPASSPANAVARAFDSGFSGTASRPQAAHSDAGPAIDTRADSLPPSTNNARDAGLRPGDIVAVDDNPFVAPMPGSTDESGRNTANVVIPDTAITVPAANPPEVPAMPRSTATGSWSLLAWLGGAGLAVFIGLLLFGRRMRQRFGSTPIAADAISPAGPRHADHERRSGNRADVDFEFDSGSTDAASMSLDADLGLGTGFRDGSDMDLAQDFGFSASADGSADFDFEIPAGADDETELHPTDIIPPSRHSETSILDSEIPPSDDDDDDYDLSMIVDATRQPVVDTHLTAKDLKAVAVSSADEDDTSEYTLSREIDYKILEQDYQEEFTTTQALNAEIARAAMELAESMEKSGEHADTAALPHGGRKENSAEITAELPQSSESEITAELTANLVNHGDAVNDDLIADLDDTGINEQLTAELPRADNDVTVEMDVEGGRIDTKKTRAS